MNDLSHQTISDVRGDDDRDEAPPALQLRINRRVLPGRARLLLAEDDAELRSLVAGVLRKDGYEVVEATDGGRLLVHLAEGWRQGDPGAAYDLLVTDLRMPVVNGMQILESLRAVGWRVPAIVMTAFGDEPTRRKIESLSGVMFGKPFDVDDLRTAVLHFLRPTVTERSETPSLVRICSYATWPAAREAKGLLRLANVDSLLAGAQVGPVGLYVVARDEERSHFILAGAATTN